MTTYEKRRIITGCRCDKYTASKCNDKSNSIIGRSSTGAKLGMAMRDTGISKHQLCKATGISYTTVTRLMSGDRIGALDTWLKIADAMGMSLQDLLDYEGEECE